METFRAIIHARTLEDLARIPTFPFSIHYSLAGRDGQAWTVPGVLTLAEIEILKGEGYAVDIIEPLAEYARRQYALITDERSAALFDAGNYGSPLYNVSSWTTKRITDFLMQMAQRFPSLATLKPLPNMTERQPPWGEPQRSHALVIKAPNANPNRTAVLFTGGMHAREWGTSDCCVQFIWFLLSSFSTKTDMTFVNKTYSYWTVKEMMEKLEIIVFPNVNPDGKNYAMNPAHEKDNGVDWRKNRRYLGKAADGKTDVLGVDINRNFDFMWGKYFGASNKPRMDSYLISNDKANPLYKGEPQPGVRPPRPRLEAETRNVIWLLDQYPNIRFYMDVHSSAGKIAFPWGCDENGDNPDMTFMNGQYDGRFIRGEQSSSYREYMPAADQRFYARYAAQVAKAAKSVQGSGYTPVQSWWWDAEYRYPTIATSDDYAYSRHFSNPRLGKIWSLTLEFAVLNPKNSYMPDTREEMLRITYDVGGAMAEVCNVALNPALIEGESEPASPAES